MSSSKMHLYPQPFSTAITQIETEVQTWIQKYDQDMGDVTDAIEKMQVLAVVWPLGHACLMCCMCFGRRITPLAPSLHICSYHVCMRCDFVRKGRLRQRAGGISRIRGGSLAQISGCAGMRGNNISILCFLLFRHQYFRKIDAENARIREEERIIAEGLEC